MNEIITKRETTMLKGIAILLIVIEHMGQAYDVGIVNPLGPIGVCLFLFLSGYGLSCSYQENGRKNYFRKKIFKVYVPYVLTVGLFLLWGGLCLRIPLTGVQVVRFFTLLELPQGSYWYLILMFYWYVMFYLLTFIYKHDSVLIPSLFICSFMIIVIENYQRGYVWQFFSFPIGVILGKHRFNIETGAKKWSPLLICLSIITVLIKKTSYVESHELGVADTILQIVLTLSLSNYIVLNRKKIMNHEMVQKMMLFLGAISYELYLSHAIALDYIKGNPSIDRLLVYCTVTISCVVVLRICGCLAFYRRKRRL